MKDQELISSFVLRFSLANRSEETGGKQWRIRVTHVQGKEETSFSTMEEAVKYMQKVLGE